MKTIIVKKRVHRGLNRLTLSFEYDTELISVIRTLEDCRWSATMKCWHVPDTEGMVSKLINLLNGKATLHYSVPERGDNPEHITSVVVEEKLPDVTDRDRIKLEEFRKWMIHKRYSDSSINTYTGMLSQFFRFINPKESSEITADDMVRYVNDYIIPRGLSYTFQNQVINAAKLFYRYVYKSDLDVDTFERPRREHRLPNVLSKEEVKQIIGVVTNTKHRVMLSLIYACGLRRGECINLKPGDIDSRRGVLIIRQGKGNKDRIVPISEKLVKILREYYVLYRPGLYLFEGQVKGEQYSASSMQKVLKEACNKAGVNKPVTLHWLRHSYATHLLDSGTDLRFIQELLGHKSSRTTELYTHVSIKSLQKIRSPFDDL